MSLGPRPEELAELVKRALTDPVIVEKSKVNARARIILGEKVERTLSQLLEDHTPRNSRLFNFSLAAVALYTAQHGIAAYLCNRRPELTQDPDMKKLAGIDLQQTNFRMATYCMSLLSASNLPETGRDHLFYRIAEQQGSFLQGSSLTKDDLAFFLTSHTLTALELTNPDDHGISPTRVQNTGQVYGHQRQALPLDRALRALTFPNELRQAVGLAPLT